MDFKFNPLPDKDHGTRRSDSHWHLLQIRNDNVPPAHSQTLDIQLCNRRRHTDTINQSASTCQLRNVYYIMNKKALEK